MEQFFATLHTAPNFPTGQQTPQNSIARKNGYSMLRLSACKRDAPMRVLVAITLHDTRARERGSGGEAATIKREEGFYLA